MGKFLQFIFASCLGFFLAILVIVGISSIFVGKAVSEANTSEQVKPNSVLVLDFNEGLPERTNNVPVSGFEFRTEKKLGLTDVVEAIERAKDDDDIKGILLDLSGISMGQATASTVREALLDFKSDDKFIAAYGQYYSQGAYYMASAADKVYLNPIGDMDFRGFGTMIPFFKDMLDRLDIKMQIFYAGKFKSATEPFRRDEMSEENRLQIKEYLGPLYEQFLTDIAVSRNMTTDQLRDIADNGRIQSAEDAKALGLVDELGYRDEMQSYVRQRLGLEEDDKINSIGINTFNEANPGKADYGTKDRIAVVYAEGSIVDGKGENGSIGGDTYSAMIRKLRKDDKVKAIVIRVNSGGGSAWASDNIWREIEMAKEKGIPVVASMGDVAASGGYYIACNADTIFAAPNTITGSIGVFGILPSMQGLFEKKMGIHFDTVQTGPYAISPNINMDASPRQAEILQKQTDRIYEIFLERVAEGRDMTKEQVHEIAQGRVWVGTKAEEINLVDQLGGLEDAIACAARLANLDEYRLKELPAIKEPVQEIIDQFMGDKPTVQLTETIKKEQLGDLYPYFRQLEEFKDLKGVQARLPFVLNGF